MVKRVAGDWNVRLVFEPGRLIVANAGVLLSRVIRVKPGATDPFVIVDAAMNDLMRPALYDAWHRIEAVKPSGRLRTANVVGPVCETGDTFATARRMDDVGAGDLVVFRTAGAYAAAMASTYNSRPLTPEVLVDGSRWAVVRPRVDVEALIAERPHPRLAGRLRGLAQQLRAAAMARIVMKFGGTSMAGIERIRHVAGLVKREADRGNDVAVVVCAMAGETDRLVQLCKEAAPLYDAREYDVVVASGEQVTAGLLAITLSGMDVNARSYMGWQLPIRASGHSSALIDHIEAEILEDVFAGAGSPSSPASRASPPKATSRPSGGAVPTPRPWHWRSRSRPTAATSTPTSRASSPPIRASFPGLASSAPSPTRKCSSLRRLARRFCRRARSASPCATTWRCRSFRPSRTSPAR